MIKLLKNLPGIPAGEILRLVTDTLIRKTNDPSLLAQADIENYITDRGEIRIRREIVEENPEWFEDYSEEAADRERDLEQAYLKELERANAGL